MHAEKSAISCRDEHGLHPLLGAYAKNMPKWIGIFLMFLG